MSKIKKKAIVDKEYCVACGSCVKVCPLQIITIEKGVFANINSSFLALNSAVNVAFLHQGTIQGC